MPPSERGECINNIGNTVVLVEIGWNLKTMLLTAVRMLSVQPSMKYSMKISQKTKKGVP